MWFAALGNYQQVPWLIHFCDLLMEGSPSSWGLLAPVNHFNATRVPVAVKGMKGTLDFTRWGDSGKKDNGKKEGGKYNRTNWWHSTSEAEEYLPVLERQNPSVSAFLNEQSWPRLTAAERKALGVGHRCGALEAVAVVGGVVENVQLCRGLDWVKVYVGGQFSRLFVVGFSTVVVSSKWFLAWVWGKTV